jgi:cysteine-rich repeat protein
MRRFLAPLGALLFGLSCNVVNLQGEFSGECSDGVDNDDDGQLDCEEVSCSLDPFCLCGNGVVDANEACDDGNAISGDGCSGDCQKIEVCGDGVLDVGEDCDDGNADNTDDCVIVAGNAAASCKVAFCGDGFTQAGLEECDDANAVAEPDPTDTCVIDQARGILCKNAICGDGIQNTSGGFQEQCDSGPPNGAGGACQVGCTIN